MNGVGLEVIESALQKACGLSLSSALKRTLQASSSRAAAALGLDEDRFLAGLASGDGKCVASLVEHSVIGETYFFRHPEQFAALRELLARDFSQVDSLRVWSAGCATGEEPYSLAMALLDARPARAGDSVVATDVSARSLQVAREGVYGKWSLRRLDPQLRNRHFQPAGSNYRVGPAPRTRVSFRQHNLVHDAPAVAGAHVVFCRNVLIYFVADTAARVLRSLCDALAPGGYLVLGPVEVPQAAVLPLEWSEIGGATVLRKPDGRLRPVRAAVAVASPRRASASAPRPAMRRRCSSPAIPAFPATAATPPPPAVASRFEQAREAARAGRLEEAERLARGAACEDMSPESFLLLSMAAESRGDLQGAVEQVRKALYLEPSLATAHAFLVALFGRLGQPAEADRARRNALDALEGVDEATVLPGVEAITAGALRRALAPSRR
jgi:chemotaxis protein methyltransferase CheR